MPKKSVHLLLVVMMLAASALACNTVMGGSARDLDQDDLQATADALDLDSPAQATIAAAEETAAALSGDDNGDDSTDDNGNDSGDDTGDDNGDTDNPFEGQGPPDIPVLNNNAELVYADDSNLTYNTDATFDETVDFYREEMVNAGWEPSPNGDTVFAQIAALQFEKDGQQALIAITGDPTSDRTAVVITIT
jgi:hypothetical protein